MTENGKKEEAALEKLPELERRCSGCNGRGRWGSDGACGLCDGTGYELTEAGEKVLCLMRHRFRGILKKAISSESE